MNSSEKWAEVRVGDLGQVFTGRTPSTKCPEYFGNEVLFITPGDMHQGKHIHATERSLSNLGASLLKRIQLPPKSICVSCIGWQMGEVAMTSAKSITNQQINSIVPNGDVDPDFLYYSFVPRKQELLSLASAIGVRTPILNKSGFCDLRIMLPALPTQRKIVAILSAYDDLIENNTRRIKILEEMAQALYREWFVNFRFPGHEKVQMVDSPLGKMPEGWEAVTVRDICSYINRGIPPKYNDDSEYIVINQKCIRDGKLNLEPSRRHLSKVPKEKYIQFGDILINSTGVGTLGRVAQVYQVLSNSTVDSHVSIVRPNNNVTIDYFGLSLLNQQNHFESLGTGSTGQSELNRDSIANSDFLLPPISVQLRFNGIVEPMRKSMITMLSKNYNLRCTRDLLLSKLISGELNVDPIDIKNEAMTS
jgi:type I restriction enzyme, S subunit